LERVWCIVFWKKKQKVIAMDINFDGLLEKSKEWKNLFPHINMHPIYNENGSALSETRRDTSADIAIGKLDITDTQQWKAAYKNGTYVIGDVDIHINIAGFLKTNHGSKVTEKEVHQHIDINTKGSIFGTLQALDHFRGRGGGHIITIGSLATLLPYSGLSLYAASKAAVRSYTLALAKEMREEKTGIYVSLVNPDSVATPMLDIQVDKPEALLTFSTSHILTPDDVINKIFNKVLVDRPMQVNIPYGRGVLATIGGVLFTTRTVDLMMKFSLSSAQANHQAYAQQISKRL